HRGHAEPPPGERRRDAATYKRFAHSGVRPGDTESNHGVLVSTNSAIVSYASASWSAVEQYGGRTYTVLPSGRSNTPRSMANLKSIGPRALKYTAARDVSSIASTGPSTRTWLTPTSVSRRAAASRCERPIARRRSEAES